MGIIIDVELANFLGIPETVYRYFSAIIDTGAAVLVTAGVVVLAVRRLFVPRVRSPPDWLVLVLLLVVIITGIIPTIAVNLVGSGYHYRETAGARFRGLFSGQPDMTATTTAPLLHEIHATAAWVIWGVWPFTRLVHAGSYPLWFLWRPYIVYRSRVGMPLNEPGTGGRTLRRIGTPL